MNQAQWTHKCELIHAMDVICRGFNDEEWIEPWLVNGVPDGTDTVEDVMGVYPNDDDFEEEFKRLQGLFVSLVTGQCLSDDVKGMKVIDPTLAESLIY